MLLSGIVTLVWEALADHTELAFNNAHDSVKSSSPKYHAQPAGLFDDESVNRTLNGALPEVKSAVKMATGVIGVRYLMMTIPDPPAPDDAPVAP